MFVVRCLFTLALALMAFAALPGASADITHNIRFQSGPQIVTWGDIGRAAPAHHTSLPVMTGLLVSVSDETPRLANASAARFKVATNTAFVVHAEIVGARRLSSAELADMMVELEIASLGPNADPALMAQSGTRFTLAQLLSDPNIFKSHQRTAVSTGSPESQAVAFEARWDGARRGVSIRFHVSALT